MHPVTSVRSRAEISGDGVRAVVYPPPRAVGVITRTTSCREQKVPHVVVGCLSLSIWIIPWSLLYRGAQAQCKLILSWLYRRISKEIAPIRCDLILRVTYVLRNRMCPESAALFGWRTVRLSTCSYIFLAKVLVSIFWIFSIFLSFRNIFNLFFLIIFQLDTPSTFL